MAKWSGSNPVDNPNLIKPMTIPVTAFAQFVCFFSSHTDNQIKCQLGDYNKKTRQWL